MKRNYMGLLLLFVILVMALQSMAACQSDEGHRERTGNRWEGDYTKYNSRDSELFLFSDGNVIHLEVKRKKGTLTITVRESKGDDIYFQETVKEDFSCDIMIPENAEVEVSGKKFAGIFRMESQTDTIAENNEKEIMQPELMGAFNEYISEEITENVKIDIKSSSYASRFLSSKEELFPCEKKELEYETVLKTSHQILADHIELYGNYLNYMKELKIVHVEEVPSKKYEYITCVGALDAKSNRYWIFYNSERVDLMEGLSIEVWGLPIASAKVEKGKMSENVVIMAGSYIEKKK